MKANEIERAVIAQLLLDAELSPIAHTVDFERVNVIERAFTEVGCLTEFEATPELKLFAADISLRWGKVGARLNAGMIETAYIAYVDSGQLTGIEGYTYGDEWPRVISSIEVYELKPGMALGSRT